MGGDRYTEQPEDEQLGKETDRGREGRFMSLRNQKEGKPHTDLESEED